MCHSHLNKVQNYNKCTPNSPEQDQVFNEFDQEYIPEEIVVHKKVLNSSRESSVMISQYLNVINSIY